MTAGVRSALADSLARLSAWSADPSRSLHMFAAGAVVGLALAGFSLFTAKGAATRVVPPEDVALVNQRPILLSDFNAQLAAQYAVPLGQITPAERRATLDDMIREELMVQRGLELDMPSSDPDVRSALVAAVEQQVAANVTAQSLTEAQLRAYYDAHRDTYASEGVMALHDLVRASGAGPAGVDLAAARRAAVEIARGEPPATVMAREGLKDSGKVEGEEFYFAARIHLGDALFDVARRLPDGAVSAPVVRPDGAHVLMMVRNTPPVPQPFDQAEPRVQLDDTREIRDRVAAGELKYLREKADILITPSLR